MVSWRRFEAATVQDTRLSSEQQLYSKHGQNVRWLLRKHYSEQQRAGNPGWVTISNQLLFSRDSSHEVQSVFQDSYSPA